MWILDYNINKAEIYANLILNQFKFDEKGDEVSNDTAHLDKKKYKYLLPCIRDYLNKSKIKEFLIGSPNDLLELHKELFLLIINECKNEKLTWDSFRESEMEEYIQAVYYLKKNKIKEGASLTPKSSDQIEKYKKTQEKLEPIYGEFSKFINCIKRVFDYNKIIVNNQDISYRIAEIMDVNTCTYCNRNYIFTLNGFKRDLSNNLLTTEHIIRADFDHWFAKSKYPELALSYFNLIPSCKYCNSNLKGDKEMTIEEYVHPYIHKEPKFKFGYVMTNIDNYAVRCIIEKKDGDPNSYQVRNTLNFFKIQNLYDAHSRMELKDILDLISDYPSDYIDYLTLEIMGSLGVTQNEVYRMIFGIQNEEIKYLDRPFSKFKSDILKQIRSETDYRITGSQKIKAYKQSKKNESSNNSINSQN